MTVKWSFIIPVLNGAHDLPRCLNGIERQSLPAQSYEVLIVDNCKTATTFSIAQTSELRVLHEPRQGVSRARNLGITAARGDILVFLDVDVELGVGWIEAADEKLKARWVDVVQSPIIPVGPSDDALMETFRRDFIGLKTNGRFEYLSRAFDNQAQINSAAFAIKRSVLRDRVRFDPELKRCEDTDFTYQLIFNGANIALLSKVKSYVTDRRTWWQYVLRSFSTGLWSARVSRAWGQAGYWSPPVLKGSLLVRLNTFAHKLGVMVGGVHPTTNEKVKIHSRADVRNLFYWMGQPRLRLSPWVRLVDLDDALVLTQLQTGERAVLAGNGLLQMRYWLNLNDDGTLPSEENFLPPGFLLSM